MRTRNVRSPLPKARIGSSAPIPARVAAAVDDVLSLQRHGGAPRSRAMGWPDGGADCVRSESMKVLTLARCSRTPRSRCSGCSCSSGFGTRHSMREIRVIAPVAWFRRGRRSRASTSQFNLTDRAPDVFLRPGSTQGSRRYFSVSVRSCRGSPVPPGHSISISSTPTSPFLTAWPPYSWANGFAVLSSSHFEDSSTSSSNIGSGG